MRTKFASTFVALASFLAITALGAALAGAEPLSDSTTVSPAPTTTTAIPSLAAPACANGLDDDHDGLVDTEDPDCESPEDTTEVPPATTPSEATESEEVPAPAPAPEKGSKGGVKHGSGIGSPGTTGSGKDGTTRNDELAAPGSGGDNGGVSAPRANRGGGQPLPQGSKGRPPQRQRGGGSPSPGGSNRRPPVHRRRPPPPRQPADDDRPLRSGADRGPQLRHRLLRNPAIPAADLPGLRNRIRDPLGGARLDQ